MTCLHCQHCQSNKQIEYDLFDKQYQDSIKERKFLQLKEIKLKEFIAWSNNFFEKNIDILPSFVDYNIMLWSKFESCFNEKDLKDVEQAMNLLNQEIGLQRKNINKLIKALQFLK